MSPNSTNAIDQNEENSKKTANRTMKSRYAPLPEKHFEIRNSLITDLCENIPHVASIHNLFVASIICLFTSIFVNDYLVRGEISLGFELIKSSFAGVHVAAFFWTIFFIVTCFVHVVFNTWAIIRIKLIAKHQALKIWDRLWTILLLAFYFFAFRISSMITVVYDLPAASASIILLEQTRMTMKIHAFVRYNAQKIVTYKPHSDQILDLPRFKNYLYFLFAPTIVYRDEYPRTDKIHWGFVVMRILEIIGVVFYQCFLFHRFIFPAYRTFGLKKFTWLQVITPIIENSIPGLLILMSGFYQVLHSVQNLFAELLRFGDRQFYKDWWNCTNFSEYFRIWNIVVHDWLYAYVYRDLHYLTKGNKVVAKFAVFITSAVVHEWVLTYQFKFFYPVIIYCYMAAAFLSLFKIPKFRFVNILFWYGMAFGSGLIISLYTLEHFARTNNPDTEYGFMYYFVPRWYSCDCIV